MLFRSVPNIVPISEGLEESVDVGVGVEAEGSVPESESPESSLPSPLVGVTIVAVTTMLNGSLTV